MINTLQAKNLIENAIIKIYQALQQGMDVSPGECLRLEGKIELLLDFHVIEWQWLISLTRKHYVEYFGVEINEAYWQWLEAEKRFMLPVKMQDAPVYKS